MKSDTVIQSVDRALRIIDCFCGNAIELGISEIAEKMELSKSTVFGLVNTLAMNGYLEQNEENKKYRLGIKLFELGNLVGSRMDLRKAAFPYCRKLSEDYKQGVHLAVRSGDEMIYIDKIDVPGLSIAYSYVGKRAQMYCTGVGKAILAYLPEEELKQYLEHTELKAMTPHTITDSDELQKELEQIRSRSFAMDDEEVEEGLKCVAAPIFDWRGAPVAAISSSGMASRMTDEVIRILQKDVVAYAAAISYRMGYKP